MESNLATLFDELDHYKSLLEDPTLTTESRMSAVYDVTHVTRNLKKELETTALASLEGEGGVDVSTYALDIEEGLEALDTLIETRDGLEALSITAESVTLETDLQRQMAQHALTGYARRLGLESTSISLEGLGDVIKKIWEAIVKAVETVAKKIGDFFKAIWRFITGKKRSLKETQKRQRSLANVNTGVSDYIKEMNKEFGRMEAERIKVLKAVEYGNTGRTVSDLIDDIESDLDKLIADGKEKETNKNKKKELTDGVKFEARTLDVGDLFVKTGTFTSWKGIPDNLTIDDILAIGDGIVHTVKELNNYTSALPKQIDDLIKELGDEVDEDKFVNLTTWNDLFVEVAAGGLRKVGYPTGNGVRAIVHDASASDKKMKIEMSEFASKGDEFTVPFPTGKELSDLTTQGIKVANALEDLSQVERNISTLQKTLDRVKAGELEGVKENNLKQLQTTLSFTVSLILLPLSKALGQGGAFYVSFMDSTAKRGTNVYLAVDNVNKLIDDNKK